MLKEEQTVIWMSLCISCDCLDLLGLKGDSFSVSEAAALQVLCVLHENVYYSNKNCSE